MKSKDTKICKQCKSSFERQTTGTKKCGLLRWETRKFCSNPCKMEYSRTAEYRKENPPTKYWQGKKLSEEHKAKQSAAKVGKEPWNKGKKLSPEHVAKLSGKNANNWQGGKTSKNQIIRHRKEMREWRTAVYERDNYTCQECGDRSSKGNQVTLNAHHLKPFSQYPELRFDVDNGQTLCAPCHYLTDTFGHKVNRAIKTAA